MFNVNQPTAGDGWRVINNLEVEVDGFRYVGYTKAEEALRDCYIRVGPTELCFHNNSKWQDVVGAIRKARREFIEDDAKDNKNVLDKYRRAVTSYKDEAHTLTIERDIAVIQRDEAFELIAQILDKRTRNRGWDAMACTLLGRENDG